jgi:hypothetical protein
VEAEGAAKGRVSGIARRVRGATAGAARWRLSHRVPGSTGSRDGDEERGTPILNTVWNDEYTASVRSEINMDRDPS